jgi:hypothetical protein
MPSGIWPSGIWPFGHLAIWLSGHLAFGHLPFAIWNTLSACLIEELSFVDGS